MTERLPAELVAKAVLSAGLAGCVVVVFVVVEGLAQLTGGSAGTGAWLVGALMLALVVPLLRPRLERLANRAAYGRRGDPYAVLETFVQRIADTLAVDDVLPELARTAVQATHSSSGGVRLRMADGAELHETWPPGVPETPGEVRLVLEHGGEELGSLEVSGADAELRDADRMLLNRLAGPAGLALSNVRLTLDLRRRLAQTTALTEQIRLSRQRLLEAGRDQRERFAVAVRRRVIRPLAAVEDQLTVAPHPAAPSVRSAELATRESLEALRDLAAGVFPPALSDRGVVEALRLHVNRHDEPVLVEEPHGAIVRYPAEVESAAYFCCAALTDELAGQSPVALDLAGDAAQLTFVARGTTPLASSVEQLVRDRVEALGGDLAVSPMGPGDGTGLEVQGRLPVGGVQLSAILERIAASASTPDAARSEQP